jgi:uncharacterized protein
VFEWDPRKAEANAAKHGVTFDDAVTVFLDPDALDGPDLQHSAAESRFRRLGRAADGQVLIVAYTLRRSGDAEAIRIISARRASRRERAAYAKGLTSRISRTRRRSSWRPCAGWVGLRSGRNPVS